MTDHLPEWDGFVAGWLPGSEGAAIGGVLFGDYPFRGRLPYRWPRYADQIGYAHADEPPLPARLRAARLLESEWRLFGLPPQMPLQREKIAVPTEAADLPGAGVGNDRVMAERLAGIDVGNVNLDGRRRHGCYRVA